jgi:hypothetical protein
VSAFIWDQVNELDGIQNGDEDSLDEKDDSGPLAIDDGHVALGSKQSSRSFRQLEQSHLHDSGFKDFRIKCSNFLNNFLPTHGIPLPDGKRITFHADNSVSVPFCCTTSILTDETADNRVSLS